MARLSANLGFLFTERPQLERPGAAAETDFRAVEMHYPYDVPAPAMRASLIAAGVAMLALNTPIGEGEAAFGLGAVRGREADFQVGVDQALGYGQAIGATALHCMAGCVPESESVSCEDVFVRNLPLAADKAAHAGIALLIEPINHRDRPGYALSRVEQAASIIERTGRANLRIMFDCYHVQIMQGDLIRRLTAHLLLIGHVQIAAVPSRAEPDEGELNAPEILRALDGIGYSGCVGAEYRPRDRTEDGLGWLEALGAARTG